MPEAPRETVSIDTLQTILETDRKYRERRHAEWTENYLLYRSRVITNRLTQRQSINVPYTKETVRVQVAKTAAAPDIFFESLANDKQKEILKNEYWLECARQNKITLLDIVDRKQEALYGRSYMMLTIQDGRIVFTILDPQDVLLDRFMKPWDIGTARHVTLTGIFRPLSELARNPLYTAAAIKDLKTFFTTKAGLLKASDNAQLMADKAERMRQMGVTDVLNPQVGEIYVEVNQTEIMVPDEKTGRDIAYIVSTAEGRKIAERKMQDILGINRFNICTWAGDVEATDIYSDGAADIARPLNQLANVRISQKAENGSLLNWGMQFYDTTDLPDGWSPVGYEPGPFAFFGFPGDPNKKMKRVDIPEMNDVFQELGEYKAMIEAATATVPITKGESDDGDQTKYEIQILAAQAQKRISSGAPLSEQYWQDIAELFSDLVDANPDLLEPAKLYKKDAKGNYWPRVVKPQELVDPGGWKARITSKAKKDAEALETIQKLRIGKAEFPANAPLARIMKKKVLNWLDLKPEEQKEIMDFDEQNPMPPVGPDGKPLLPAPVPVPVRQPSMSGAPTSLTDA